MKLLDLLRFALAGASVIFLLSGCLSEYQSSPSPEEQQKIQQHMQQIKAQIEQLQAEMTRLQAAKEEAAKTPEVAPEPVAPPLPTDVSLLFSATDKPEPSPLYTYILSASPAPPPNLPGLLRDLGAGAPTDATGQRFVVPTTAEVVVDQPLGHIYSAELAAQLLASLQLDPTAVGPWLVTTTEPLVAGEAPESLVIAQNLEEVSPFFRDRILTLYRGFSADQNPPEQNLKQLLWQLAQLSAASQSPGNLSVHLSGQAMSLTWQP